MPNSWGITARSDRTIMSWAAKFCGSLYDIVGEVDFLPDKPGKFFWGKDAAAAPVARECFYVLKRKSVPR